MAGSCSGTVVSGLLFELDVSVSSVISASLVWNEVSESVSVAVSVTPSAVSSNLGIFGVFRLIRTTLLVDVMVGGGMFGVIGSCSDCTSVGLFLADVLFSV